MFGVKTKSMKILLVVVIATMLTACGKDTAVHASEENSKVVMIAVNEHGEVFMSTQNLSMSVEEFSNEVAQLLEDGSRYRFIIQSDDASRSIVNSVADALYRNGIDARYVTISRNHVE